MIHEPMAPPTTAAATPLSEWCSGAADMQDVDDTMWDDFLNLAPQQVPEQAQPDSAPTELISGASPAKTTGYFQALDALDPCNGGNTSPSSGEDQAPPPALSVGGASRVGASASKLDAVWAAGAAAQPVAGRGSGRKASKSVSTTSARPLTWDSAAPERLLDCGQLPNAGAMQVRRQKNRECMRRARQRQREELRDMKITVARLEKQYAALCLRASASVDDVSSTLRAAATDNDGALVSSKATREYTQAVELVKRLGAENLYLKAEIQQQATWKLHLYRILESRPEMDGPSWAQQFQQRALGGEEALKMQLDRLDEFEAAQVFGFHPLTELDLTSVILENNRAMSRVQNRLLIPSTLDTQGRTRTRRMQTFGWDIVQRVEGSVMECVFTKKFTGLNVAELMQKTWANDMRLDQFKKVKCETRRLEVLQQVNPNAYVLGRDVASPTDISTFRSVFVRFLIETSRKMPASSESMSSPTFVDASAPSTPPLSPDSDCEAEELMLEATGYVLGTQSVNTDCSGHSEDVKAGGDLAWADLSLSIEFLNVVNPATREEYQQLRWTGRTDYCGEEHAHRNAADTLQGMLRWEMLTIAPALNLVSLSLE
ncbi:hypothetical protein BBJ28_00016719 [Nothophytophthora sp. Chile5]|nr:hypothetical protein BBJ28_00016719 [Nothophytophthora sp. Chile5]